MTGLTAAPAVAWLEKFQIPLYLAALAGGALVGIVTPASAPTFEHAINPVLIVLLYATFLAVPFERSGPRCAMADSCLA